LGLDAGCAQIVTAVFGFKKARLLHPISGGGALGCAVAGVGFAALL